jgi:hypothetical protein
VLLLVLLLLDMCRHHFHSLSTLGKFNLYTIPCKKQTTQLPLLQHHFVSVSTSTPCSDSTYAPYKLAVVAAGAGSLSR